MFSKVGSKRNKIAVDQSSRFQKMAGRLPVMTNVEWKVNETGPATSRLLIFFVIYCYYSYSARRVSSFGERGRTQEGTRSNSPGIASH